jgi:DsbC/DsbD-like thiol-disulfide interchange protein
MKLLIFCAAMIQVVLLAAAQNKPGAVKIKETAIQGELKPGATVIATVKVELEKGYHVHSNKPSQKEFIATELSIKPSAGVTAGKIKYPEGKSMTVQGLPKPLSVYEERFEISVPLTLAADSKLPLTAPATLSYQACQGAVCYPPRKLTFDITLRQ